MAPADPALDDGADDEPNEPELDDDPELDDEPELADEPEPEDPVPADPVLEDPVPDDPVPELAECPVLLLLVVLCAAAGSPTITTPAAATPTIPVPMVALRSRRRAWSRAKMADTVRSSLCIQGLLYRGQYPISVGGADLTMLGSSSPVAQSPAARPGRPG